MEELRKIFKVNENGYGWDESQSRFVPSDMDITVAMPYTLNQPPTTCYKPFYDWVEDKWIETATQIEIDEIMLSNDAPDQTAIIEKYERMIDALLKAQQENQPKT